MRGGEPEAQQLGHCTSFCADLLPLSSSTTLHGAMAQSSHSHGCHPGLAGPGAWSWNAAGGVRTGSAVESCCRGWARYAEGWKWCLVAAQVQEGISPDTTNS